MTGILRLVMVGFDVLAIVLFYIAASAWRNRRRLSSSVGFLAAVLCLTIGVLLGLETVYELDRIAGRYQAISDERSQQRTVYSLAASKPFDAFDLARRYLVLRPFVDAEYGSATFIGATARGGGTYEVRVSTQGLLVRRVAVR